MAQVVMTLDRRDQPWVLQIEPWALALDVPADELVRVTIEVSPENPEIPLSLEVSDEGKFLGFWEPVFSVAIGARRFDYKFPEIT